MHFNLMSLLFRHDKQMTYSDFHNQSFTLVFQKSSYTIQCHSQYQLQHILNEVQVMIQNLWGVVFHYLGPTFINAYIVKLLQTWLIETESNMGIMVLLDPEMFSLSALSSLFVLKQHYSKSYEQNPVKFYGGVGVVYGRTD